MPIKINLGQSNYLTPINAHELAQIENDLFSRCVMCRDILDRETSTVEHIYPKWLQNEFNLWDKRLTLPNGSSIPYRQLTVPCCKECNGGIMADWEKRVQNAVEQGYDAFVQLEEEIIAWWIYKLYYTKLIKELSLKSDIRDPNSEMIFTDRLLKDYYPIYYYMCELIKGTKFSHPKPYELYIYRTYQDHSFDYIDDIARHVVYIEMNDILIVCALDSFGFFSVQYEKELQSLNSMDKISSIQALELFVKIVYYRTHYKFDTGHGNIINNTRLIITSKIINPQQIREFNLEELYTMMVSLLHMRGYPGPIPEYKEKSMFSFICGHECTSQYTE